MTGCKRTKASRLSGIMLGDKPNRDGLTRQLYLVIEWVMGLR